MAKDRAVRVIPLQPNEKTRREIAFDRSMDSLMEAMRELRLAEKVTGRSGLPERVCFAFGDALMCAMRLAGEQEQARAIR